MKKHLYVLFFIVSASFIANAQDKQPQVGKGQVYVGGDVSFIHTDGSGTGKSNAFTLAPVIGKAVRDNMLVGISLLYSHSATESYNYNAYGAGIFLRKYKPLGNGFAVFLQEDLTGRYSRQKQAPQYNGTPNETKIVSVTAGLDGGIAYKISDRVQIETGFSGLLIASYNHNSNYFSDPNNTGVPVTTRSNTFSIGSSLDNAFQNLIVGFRIVI